jgi:hypothetical protein
MRKILLIPAILLAATVIFSFRLVLFGLGSILYIYLLPWVVAQQREHPRRKEILMVSAFTGWLILPWLGALWVASRNVGDAQVHVDAS